MEKVLIELLEEHVAIAKCQLTLELLDRALAMEEIHRAEYIETMEEMMDQYGSKIR